MEINKERRTKRRGLIWFLSILLAVSLLLCGLQLGTVIEMNTWEHWRPNYAKEDISQLIVKEELTEESYYKKGGHRKVVSPRKAEKFKQTPARFARQWIENRPIPGKASGHRGVDSTDAADPRPEKAGHHQLQGSCRPSGNAHGLSGTGYQPGVL